MSPSPTPAMASGIAETRRDRHPDYFDTEKCDQTMLLVYGADANPELAGYLLAGSASADVSHLAADDEGPLSDDGESWWSGPFADLVGHINGRARLDNCAMLSCASTSLPRNSWCVLCVGEQTRQTLKEVPPGVPVIAVATGPSGGIAVVFRDAAEALCRLRESPFDGWRQPGPTCMSTLFAGLALNEIFQGGPAYRDLPDSDTIGYLDLSQRRPVDVPDGADLADLFESVAAPHPAQHAFTAQRFLNVGAGGLATGTVPALVQGNAARVVVQDFDVVSISNTGRQFWFNERDVGKLKSEVLCREMSQLSSHTVCEPRTRRACSETDLDEASSPTDIDAILCVPDNDACRALVGEYARSRGKILVTGGSSAIGGQAVVTVPGRTACFRCASGLNGRHSADDAPQSCGRVRNQAIVSSNLVVAGLLVAQLSVALTGGRPANLRFLADVRAGNRLRRMASPSSCPHCDPVPTP